MNCPVCLSTQTTLFMEDGDRKYWRCGRCETRFMGPDSHLSSQHEYDHYLLHENNTGDLRYRTFLEKLANPLLKKLKPASSGLDYGCGPGPALAAMMREAGHEVKLFDPYFRNDEQALSQIYDFVTCSETVEHFYRPLEEFSRLDSLLKNGGWLAIMTCFQTDDDAFAQWYYRRDPTHVVFYREATLFWLAKHFGWCCEFPVKDVVLMQKTAKSAVSRSAVSLTRNG